MLKKLLTKKMAIVVASVATLVLSLSIFPVVKASQPRDYDNNAVIYGGAFWTSELNEKLNKGTGKPHQSSAELKALFKELGMGQEHLVSTLLSSGEVHKDGRVTVNGKTVATNVKSAGRQYMPGSTRDNNFSYPIYWRSPSVSFRSQSIPAFVYMNYDGTMAFAIIKSCGNPVKGVGVRVRPTPTYKLSINKFNDLDADRVRDNNEPMIAGWTFRITGPNYDRTVQTSANGGVTVTNLKAGTYRVTEVQKSGWTNTTPLTQTATITNANRSLWFGNRQIPVTPQDTYTIRARKYEDLNGNATREENEPWLAGWTIRLSGNNLDRSLETNGEGTVSFSNLPAGTYTVTEVQQTGWTNTTPLTQTVVIPNRDTLEGYAEFGNKRVVRTVTPTGKVETQPLPSSGPLDAAMGAFGGISLASAGIYYRRGKKNLLNAFKKIK